MSKGGHALTVALATMGRRTGPKEGEAGGWETREQVMVIISVRDKWLQPPQWSAERKQDTYFLLHEQRVFCLNHEPSEQSWMRDKVGGLNESEGLRKATKGNTLQSDMRKDQN